MVEECSDCKNVSINVSSRPNLHETISAATNDAINIAAEAGNTICHHIGACSDEKKRCKITLLKVSIMDSSFDARSQTWSVNIAAVGDCCCN